MTKDDLKMGHHDQSSLPNTPDDIERSTIERCALIVDHRLQRSTDPGIRYALKCVAEDIRALKHPTQEQEAGK